MLKHVPVKNKLMAKLCAEAHGFKKKQRNKVEKQKSKSGKKK